MRNLNCLGLVLLSLLIVGGCASGGATFNSRAHVGNLSPINKILMVTNAKNRYFTESLNQGFETSLTDKLSACGIELSILQYDKMDLDFKGTLKKAIMAFGPDVLMVMKPDGGNVIVGQGGNQGTLYYEFKISDGRDNRIVWEARLGYQFLTANMFVNDRSSGEELGTELYEQLIGDGILFNCPSTLAKR